MPFSGNLRYCAVFLACLAPAAPMAIGATVVDPLAFETTPGGQAVGLAPVPGRNGMVVSAQDIASHVGADILARGGNAVDAAVAVGYAMAVVYPAAGNIGGGGFMTLRTPDGHVTFLDFREHAPGAATPDMYQDGSGHVIASASITGWKAVAIPGTVAGMEQVHDRWGKLPRADVMAPAIALARDGFVLKPSDVDLLHTSTAVFARDPYARRIFLHADGTPLAVGEKLVQSDLARTLERIARDGARAFYEGPIAREIVRSSRKGGGILSRRDFASYHTRVMAPLSCEYRGYHIDTAPPPSGGGVALCEMLNILSGYDMHALGLHTAPAVQREVEAMRHAYADRQDLGDPAFVTNPVAHLVDPDYARQVRQHLPTGHAVSSGSLHPGMPEGEKEETTHYSIADRDGMTVAVTYTLNGWFGAGVVAGRTGIVMNDEMDDFSSQPGAPNMFGIVGSTANAIAPGKTPLSSMTPTIVSRAGQPVMVVGSPGGSRIPTIVLSVMLGMVDYGLDVQQAVDLPRIHEQWQPDVVQVEKGALSPAVVRTLTHEGYTIEEHAPWGVAESILAGGPRIGRVGQARYYGGADMRHQSGAAVGE
ncbi:gamma-glutamyltransferase [Komagataeibacter sp. FNDCF1]|uniref:gamma-glutamyltransferase n=1 Tax=Komagataeibacter sp. FNDCF1 TaxID=2878681 RepID=UPI001E401000|nr:gamma-glutamyltransferase [Komagataeibacter sp. FNDCF1]MCE2564458.1 gamma-glutamyltransferase [Komagataeibacter sp. FNDCF1]